MNMNWKWLFRPGTSMYKITGTLKKKKNAKHGFPMKILLDSPEKKEFSCPSEFRAPAPQWS